MDGHSSWKSQNFTLLIFGGIVGLCSIFFVLGMLVGRSQMLPVTALSDEAPVESPDASGTVPAAPELTFYESVAEAEPSGLDASFPAEPETSVNSDEPESVAAPATPGLDAAPAAESPAPGTGTILQVVALSNGERAEQVRDELVGKGFSAFVLSPAPEAAAGLYRVQVGPFEDGVQVERVRAALVAEGYSPIVRD